MSEQNNSIVYSPDDFVWHYIDSVWAIGQVVDNYGSISIDEQPSLIAIVKTLDETNYTCVKHIEYIYPYACDLKQYFIGLRLYELRWPDSDGEDEDKIKLFLTDVANAERLTNGHPEIVADEDLLNSYMVQSMKRSKLRPTECIAPPYRARVRLLELTRSNAENKTSHICFDCGDRMPSLDFLVNHFRIKHSSQWRAVNEKNIAPDSSKKGKKTRDAGNTSKKSKSNRNVSSKKAKTDNSVDSIASRLRSHKLSIPVEAVATSDRVGGTSDRAGGTSDDVSNDILEIILVEYKDAATSPSYPITDDVASSAQDDISVTENADSADVGSTAVEAAFIVSTTTTSTTDVPATPTDVPTDTVTTFSSVIPTTAIATSSVKTSEQSRVDECMPCTSTGFREMDEYYRVVWPKGYTRKRLTD